MKTSEAYDGEYPWVVINDFKTQHRYGLKCLRCGEYLGNQARYTARRIFLENHKDCEVKEENDG